MAREIVKAIIPAAGLGTRLLPCTKSQQKEMLPVGRKPILQYVVEELQAAGFGEITTEIADASEFFYAEDYHQQYLAKNPNGYCNHGFCQVPYAGAG